MSLSTATFARLTQGGSAFPASAESGGGADERRRQARVPLGQRGEVRPVAGGAWQTVLVRDLCMDGVGLQTQGPMVTGQPLMLRLTGPAGVAVEVPCVVRWCEPGGFLRAAYHVGAAFVEPPPAQGPGPTRPAWLVQMLMDLRIRPAQTDALK